MNAKLPNGTKGWMAAISLMTFILGGGLGTVYCTRLITQSETRLQQQLSIDRARYLGEVGVLRDDIREVRQEVGELHDSVIDLAKEIR